MAYIAKDGTPINSATYATADDAIAAFKAPQWAGAPETEITMISETAFKSRGVIYNVCAGDNPKAARTAALTASRAVPRNAYRHSSYSLSRDMDRADSNN